MNNNPQTLCEKLASYVSGNASEDEKSWVRQNTASVKENEEAFRKAEQVWSRTGLPADSYEPDVEKGWQRFQVRVQARTIASPVKKPAYSMWVAAATVALLLVAGLYWTANTNQPAQTSWTEVRTGPNETKTINLADGSQVALNKNSTFSYPTNFQKENRTVRLKGEAFFEVAKAEGKRFTIFAAGTKTEVIGTSFNLRAYAKEPVKVQVVTGKVAFAKTSTDDAVFLEPGQEGVIADKTVRAVKQPIPSPNFQAWKTKSLVFRDTRLESLANELENYFGISIQIKKEALKNCRFTTSFQHPELKEVLAILAETGNLSITQNGTQYLISGPGCQD
ncbi:anti-sigma factor [Adhaeribacter aerolatus]|uniref:Anti-sigma factor n=1 Tax=Adhaeribacter aerolatus TaxID=670289 RepID=A0A512AX24_9BACT|nr:FecR domain-containing protein [Adhaeribacter aerolatus]GEO04275.1 anti-sigma factor [Adhaeribacter aerolatus]